MVKQVRRHSSIAETLVFALLWLVALTVTAGQIVEPAKSPNDSRSYAFLELPNKLELLLISDPDTDKAAASLDVRVGSGSDPDGRQGLAHFLEHMLFLGTKKYPKAGEYQAFINAHGGGHNAYTSFDDTNYFFDIDKDYLEPALDRFSQFFVAPLFSAEYVQREKNAVHSEYQLQLKNDGWRSSAAFKHVINPDHPLSRFSVGSLETLADRPDQTAREALLDFYRQHYSANLMTLVILGKEPIEQLRTWAEDKFTAIPNNNAKPLQIAAPLFADERLPARLDIVPVKDTQTLTLTFPVPSAERWYRENPIGYLAHLLGHEGKGSLLSALKRHHWADALAASGGQTMDAETTVGVRISLTDEGLEHIEDIVELMFAYLDQVRQKGVQNWLFEEQSQLAELDFQFQEPAAPIHHVRSLSRRLHRVAADDVLRAPYAMDRFDAELIEDYLARLTPDNVLVTVEARDVTTAATDPWFNTRYRISTIAADTLANWNQPKVAAQLAMPSENPFIPERLALVPPSQSGEVPVRAKTGEGVTVWYQQDRQFLVPRSELRVAVRSEAAGQDARSLVLTKLYLRMVEDQLAEFAYPALLAGLEYALRPAVNGFTIHVGGYSDKQDRLLADVIDALRKPELDPERYARVSQDLGRSLGNSRQETPYNQAMAELPVMMIRPFWSDEAQAEALKTLSMQDLEAFIPELLAEIEIEALAHGNLTGIEAEALAEMLRTNLLANSDWTTVARPAVVALTPGESAVRDLEVDNVNSAITVYYQGAARDISLRARFGLLAQVVSSPFYQTLRTERQLGYVVFASPMPLMEVPGMVFVVQSSVADAPALEGHVSEFLSGFASTVEQLPESEFEKHRAGLLSRLLEKPTTLSEQTERYWTDIRYQHHAFDSRERLIEALRGLSKADLQRDYEQILLAARPLRLVVRSTPGSDITAVASNQPKSSELVVTDPVRFKSERETVGEPESS